MNEWGTTVTLESLSTILLPAVASLIAAWFGTWLGLRKFRQERAFDARLEWHRNLAETAKTLRNRTLALKTFSRSGTPPEISQPLVKELSQLAFRFQELAETASLYSTRRTYVAIREVLAAMTKVAQPFGGAPNERDSISEDQSAEMHRVSLGGMALVYELLARDLRKMLGLEPLDEHKDLGCG